MSAGMSETPDEPRPPGEDAGDQPPTAPIPQPPDDSLPPPSPPGSPTQQALNDLPPLDDDLVDAGGRRRWLSGGRLAAAGVAVVLLLGGGTAIALAGGDDGDGGSDGVASVDGTDGDQAQGDDSGGGNSGRPDASEMQDAMLEYAECMRDHGIDMPDPEFSGDGPGMVIQGGGPESGVAAGPGGDEFQAADDECNDVLDDIRGEMPQLSPEEIAEMQDKLVAMAECMRGKGYDMPDPQVTGEGGVQIEMRGGGGDGSGGPPSDEMQQDQQECSEEAGLEGGRFGGPPAGSSTDDADGGDDGSTT